MKLILLVLTSALFVSTPSLAQITLDWQTTILCDTCKPRVAWYADTKNGHIYTSTGHHRFPIQDYRTNDAGRSWRLASDSAYAYKEYDIDDVQSCLDAGNVFWRDQSDLLFSQDSGIHWKRIHMFPVPTHVRMFTRDSGLAVRDDVELDKSHAIRLRASTDQGAYWYEEVGNPYAHPLGMRDAVILSDSELVILHSESFESEIMRTSDRGMTWTSVRKSTVEDSVVSWRLRSVDSSDILILESYFNEPVVLSLDRGKSWKVIPAVESGFIYRTRVSVLEDDLILWAAAGTAFGGAVGNLLNPEFEAAFAYNLLVSSDTGRTWQHIVIPDLPEGSLIFDIIPLRDKLNVVSYQDSVTYVSTATILQADQVVSSGSEASWVDSYPNPVKLGQMINVSLNSNSDEVHFNMTDPLGRVVFSGKLSNCQIPTASLHSGCYRVTYSTSSRLIGASKVVIH